MCVCVRHVTGVRLLFVYSIPTGESGLGKSTLVRSLFLTNLFGAKTCPPAAGNEGVCPPVMFYVHVCPLFLQYQPSIAN